MRAIAAEIPKMKSDHNSDLHETDQPLGKKLKKAVLPTKTAPAKEELRGWAKSAVKGRNKS